MCTTYDTLISDVTFKTITDYLIFVVYLLKKFGVSRTELNTLVNELDKAVTLLKGTIDTSTFNQIIYTNNRSKIRTLKMYISKRP